MKASIIISIILIHVAILQTNVHASDVCGDGVCGPTENKYYCSVDCGGSCGDTLCSRDEDRSSCPECSCVESEEDELGRLINEYRAQNNLSTIMIGKYMTIVARAHARDYAMSPPTDPDCNLHSWSSNSFDGLDFTECCYTGDHAQAPCMWRKPIELTRLTQYGFEISAVGFETTRGALEGWKNSQGHSDVILNNGNWSVLTWHSIGIGIDEPQYPKAYHVWFYRGYDDIAKDRDCVESTPSSSPSSSLTVSPVISENVSPSYTPSTSPSSSNTPSPSSSSSYMPSSSSSPSYTPSSSSSPAYTPSSSSSPSYTPSLSSSPSYTPSPSPYASPTHTYTSSSTASPSLVKGPLQLNCKEDSFKMSVVEKIGRKRVTRQNLWLGRFSEETARTETILVRKKLPLAWLTEERIELGLRFQVCGRRRVILKYYEGEGIRLKRRVVKKSKRNTGRVHDNLKKIVKGVYGRRRNFRKWLKSFIRVDVWVDYDDASALPTLRFGIEAS